MGDVAFRGEGTRPVAGRPLDEIVVAVGFLTRVPVRIRSDRPARTGAAAFGVVGAAIGLVAALPMFLAGGAHPWPAAILSVALLAAISGGLHLDGLADTFDALAAPAGSAERARTDPRTGSAGVVAIVVVLALQAAALGELLESGWTVTVIATLIAGVAVSRAATPAWAILVGRRMRPSEGLGAWFADQVTAGAVAVAVVSAVVISLLLVELGSLLVLLAVVSGTAIGSLVAGWLVASRRQLDGDGYGAIVELTLTGILLAAAVIG
ncbi:MAG TPA: adenosylcobinamide-GDP ribazoletransferase [Candidatus Limnocylindrales bacterium]|jgi:adenosylcobinamide-GDP ribazoletransferase